MVRDNTIDRLAQFRTVPGVLQHFRTDIGEPQAARRALQQANPELLLKFSDAAADGGNGHFEASRGFRKALHLDDSGKNRQRVQVHRHFSKYGNVIPSLPRLSRMWDKAYLRRERRIQALESKPCM